MPTAPAAAATSVVVDKTIQAGAQAGFSRLGLALLLAVIGTHELVSWIGGFVVLLTGGLWIFYRLQRKSPLGAMLRGPQRIPGGSRLRAATTDGYAFDAALDGLYRQRARLVAAVLWRIAERLSKAGEVWLALWLIGMPVSVGEALILESLTQAVRAAAFLAPAGIGVQEGGLVVIGAALGLGPDLSLALSLTKRFRELVVGLPGLPGMATPRMARSKEGDRDESYGVRADACTTARLGFARTFQLRSLRKEGAYRTSSRRHAGSLPAWQYRRTRTVDRMAH